MNYNSAIKVVGIIFPQILRNATEWVGSKGSTPVRIDTNGFEAVDVFLMTGALAADFATMKLWESDLPTSAFVAVAGGDFSVSPATLPTTASDANHLFRWALNDLRRAGKRYIEIEVIPGSGNSYCVAWAVLSRPAQSPEGAAARGLAQELAV